MRSPREQEVQGQSLGVVQSSEVREMKTKQRELKRMATEV